MRAVRVHLRDAALTGWRLLLRGDAHECPCCGTHVARFIPRDESQVCPRCRSRERQRLMWVYLRDGLGVESSTARVLHLAPEPALVERLQALPALRYETGDISPGPLVDRVLDARRLPFADASLDLVLCSHVLEHIAEDVQVARELARVLAPGGQALVQVPVDIGLTTTYEDASIVTPEGRLAAFGQHDHVRVYGRDVVDRLRAGGLTVTRIVSAELLTPEQRFRYLVDSERGSRPGNDIYRCVTEA